MTRSMLRRLAGATLACTVVLTAAACGQPGGASSAAADMTPEQMCPTADTTGTITITMGQPLTVFAPLLLAEQTDAFAQAGLDVQIQRITSSDALPLIAQGRADGSMTSYVAGNFNAVESGVDLKFAIPLDRGEELPPGTPVPGFWARKDLVGEAGALDLTRLRDGEVVGPTGTRGISAMILQNALATQDMSLADVRTGTIMSGPDGLVALSNGAVEAAWITAPLEVEAAKNPDLVPVAGYEPGVTGTTLVAGPSLLDRPEVMVRFLQVLSEVTETYLQGDYRADPETVRLLAAAQEVDEQTVRAASPLSFDPMFSMDGVEEFMTRMQDFLLERGELEYAEPLPIDQIVDTRFSEALAGCARPGA